MAYCYIIFSEKLNKYYVGSCRDLDARLEMHNNGHSTFTSRGIPWVLCYKEEFEHISDALKREYYIKKQKSRKFIEELIRSASK